LQYFYDNSEEEQMEPIDQSPVENLVAIAAIIFATVAVI